MSTKIGMISLGCAKNLVDAEIMLGSVLQRGMEITSHADEADVLVINTCAFIDSAKEESIEAILEAQQRRELNKRPTQKLIVSGCMSQRFSRELRESLPEVDAFIGLDQVKELGAIAERLLSKQVQDEDVDLDIVANEARPAKLGAVLSNSFGFGGTNASIVLQKFHLRRDSGAQADA